MQLAAMMPADVIRYSSPRMVQPILGADRMGRHSELDRSSKRSLAVRRCVWEASSGDLRLDHTHHPDGAHLVDGAEQIVENHFLIADTELEVEGRTALVLHERSESECRTSMEVKKKREKARHNDERDCPQMQRS